MVYITSDLFGPTTTHNREHNSTTASWQTMANSQHTAGLGKRKRHDAEEGPSTKHQSQSQHWLPPSHRESPRSHTLNNSSFDRNNMSYALVLSTPSAAASDRRPIKQLKRHSPKATLVKSTSHLMDVDLDLPPSFPPVSDLRACHACNLAPKRKRDLVNYLDCKRCDGRTCYICARQCLGGCGKAICKKCIVEVGQEGDSWCLDCYSRNLNAR